MTSAKAISGKVADDAFLLHGCGPFWGTTIVRRSGCCRILIVIAVAVAISSISGPVLAEQEQPRSFAENLPLEGIDRHTMQDQDNEALREENPPDVFAVALETHLTSEEHGTFEELPEDGSRIWRLRILSNALSLNLAFTRFELQKGDRLWIYSPDREFVYGPYTREDRTQFGELWTPRITGDEVVVEVHEPNPTPSGPDVEIGIVNHGFRCLAGSNEKCDTCASEGEDQPTISDISYDPTKGVTLTVNCAEGHTYALQRSTDFIDWQTIRDNLQGSEIQVTDQDATQLGKPWGFYRVILVAE